MDSYRNMTCILKVDTQSSGWEKSVTKVIKRIKDVSYTIDATRGIIRISGAIDPNKILIDITKAGKHAELLAADIGGSSSGGSGGRHYHSRGHGSNPSRSNGVLTLPGLEQLQHKKLQRHYDTNNSCVIL